MSSDKMDELKSLVQAMEHEYKKWKIRKIKASGSRVRNNLLEVKKIATALRKDIQDELKAMPVRSAPIKIPKPNALKRCQSEAMPNLEEA